MQNICWHGTLAGLVADALQAPLVWWFVPRRAGNNVNGSASASAAGANQGHMCNGVWRVRCGVFTTSSSSCKSSIAVYLTAACGGLVQTQQCCHQGFIINRGQTADLQTVLQLCCIIVPVTNIPSMHTKQAGLSINLGSEQMVPFADVFILLCVVPAALDACTDACQRAVCSTPHQVPAWNDACLKRCTEQCLKGRAS
jgi:hypothetical protein